MTTAAAPLQQAIYDTLTSDAALDGLITGVFDEVPASAATPYVVLGEITEAPSEAHDRSGVDATVTLNIWSRYRGYNEAAQILAAVDRLLHRPDPPLQVDGFQNVSIAQEINQFMRDPDPDLRRCMARYRVWLEEPPADLDDPDS